MTSSLVMEVRAEGVTVASTMVVVGMTRMCLLQDQEGQ